LKTAWALFKNELRLYAAGRGLALAFVLTLSLMAIFRFGMPVDGIDAESLEVFPIVVYCIANLQLLLMATHWETEGFAYRYYTMNRVSLSSLFFAKAAVSYLTQIPLWLFCIAAYFLFFPADVPPFKDLLSILGTCLPLGLALAPAGQLVAAVAQHSAQKNFLAVALFLPICLPVLIAATGRLTALLQGAETLRYDALLVAAALVFWGAGNLLFAYLFEE
jgi:ABC-type transport system involved in cytochrome c biogenesis permease component